ncbi:TPA: HNH endonuclease [Klebsiella pneumoniae]
MRYIDSTLLQLPDGWLARATHAKEAVSQGEDPNNYSDIWRCLKNGLANLSNDKCWYCELPIPRSDNAVDHFRPKGRVSDATNPHDGYRWLAFEPSNFRYACTFCNSRRKDVDGGTVGGKADRFPLQNEAQRVYQAGSVINEMPTLLDPCDIGDWQLLGCQKENGKPCAASTDAEQQARANISIDIYHLHHEPTCKLRHLEAVKLLSDIEEAKELFIATQTDATQKVAFKRVAARILKAIHANSSFSGDMRYLLRGERETNHYSWIQSLLET